MSQVMPEWHGCVHIKTNFAKAIVPAIRRPELPVPGHFRNQVQIDVETKGEDLVREPIHAVFGDQEMSFVTQNAAGFAQKGLFVSSMMQHVQHEDDIEALRFYGE